MTSWFGMPPRIVCGRLLIVTLAAFSTSAAEARGPGNDPATVITKMENVYINAKSFQGTITTKQSGKTREGKPFSVSGNRQIRFKSPNQFADQQSFSGSGAAVKANEQSLMLVADGKLLFAYSPARKQYAKRAAPPRVSLAQLMGKYLLNVPLFSLTMGTPARVNGRDAFVIVAKPKIPPQFPANVKAEDKPKIIERLKQMRPTQIFIDKQNYQLLRLMGGAPNLSDEIDFVTQTVNGTLPGGSFTFHIPAGATPFVAPAQPPPGGMAPPAAPSSPFPGIAPHP